MDSLQVWSKFLPLSLNRDGGMLVISALLLVALVFVLVMVYSLQAMQLLDLDKFQLTPYVKFAYGCFFKPHTGKSDGGQQSALESFYSAQASVYDATRKRLLCGREDMLAIVAAQLRARKGNYPVRKPVWYDIGGGTGYNIEIMDKLVDISSFFGHVYLIDLSPSLCDVARERVKKFGWTNVSILCQDARTVQNGGEAADLVTMSYSLSMIPDFYSVVDLLTGLLAPHGIIGICDFYVQSIVDISSRNYTGGVINRHVNWFSRMFWRTWFDADRVNLDAGRRDYVEYRFGTILSASERNYLLGGIPYYIFVGCRREAETTGESFHEDLRKLDAALTESPYLSPRDFKERASREVQVNVPRSKFYDSAIVNLTSNLPLPAAFYQKHHWRIHYNDLLQKHRQFNEEYIYAFNWEDPKVDRALLDINHADVILTITSAGDNILDYLLEKPRRIHAVDLNPNQNHLLELKCAAYTALSHADCWALFAEGTHPNFRDILINKLSPHLSSPAFQFWLSHASTFTPGRGGLYSTGGSRHAINMMRWLFRLFNLGSKVATFCNVETLNEQREIWPSIRDILLSWPLHWAVVSTEWWSWKAAGVPKEQRQLILDDYQKQLGDGSKTLASKETSGEAIWQYVVDTLDPVAEQTQISNDNYFYYVCLQGKYSKKCHPRYMTAKAHATLSKPDAFEGLRIHTDEIMEVISRIAPGSLTVAILMDSMDWFTPPTTSFKSSASASAQAAKATSSTMAEQICTSKSTPGSRAAHSQIEALHRVLKPGGRVLFRSASIRPWYVDIFASSGFEVRCVGARKPGICLDRVNMYASTWLCIRLNDNGSLPSPVISRGRRGWSDSSRTCSDESDFGEDGRQTTEEADGVEGEETEKESPKTRRQHRNSRRNENQKHNTTSQGRRLKSLDLGPPGL